MVQVFFSAAASQICTRPMCVPTAKYWPWIDKERRDKDSYLKPLFNKSSQNKVRTIVKALYTLKVVQHANSPTLHSPYPTMTLK